ncbi:MAG: chemotaxis response regulator protein-glutamate methylesterase [Fimbriimonadaceae bacterium]|nr:chemotaxis response regulator protein-glutamate methylesterase [Fimbriimonadaceae bacterium]
MSRTRVLVVDDSPFIRRVLTDWLKSTDEFDVVGVAANGEEALAQTLTLKPDVITLDVEMPVRDGLWALDQIMKAQPTPVIMVSSVTTQGAAATLKALELGAAEIFAKPQGSSSLKFLATKDELLDKIRGIKHARVSRSFAITPKVAAPRHGTNKVVLIASSTGGPKALSALFAALPKGFQAPIAIVQHMPPGFTKSLAQRLEGLGTIECREAEAGDVMSPGLALLAPAGLHMVIGEGGKIEFEDSPRVHGVKPAADFMFQSGAKVYGPRVVGVVLTGMGRDGADGAVAIRKAGGTVFGEAESTAMIYGMPRAAMIAGGIDAEFPINEMAHAISASLVGRVAHAS